MKSIAEELISIEQFSCLPEFRPAMDFYGGRVVQKMSPKLRHSIIQAEMLLKLNEHARPSKLGRVYPELRCTIGNCSFVFDLSFFLQDRVPRLPHDERADVTTPPDLALEILSPGQTAGELKKKFRSAIRKGLKLGWLFNPRREEILILRNGQRPEILKPGAILTGGDILPEFALPVAEVFGWLDQG